MEHTRTRTRTFCRSAVPRIPPAETVTGSAQASAARSLHGAQRALQAAAEAIDPVANRPAASRARDRLVRLRAEVEAISNLLSE